MLCCFVERAIDHRQNRAVRAATQLGPIFRGDRWPAASIELGKEPVDLLGNGWNDFSGGGDGPSEPIGDIGPGREHAQILKAAGDRTAECTKTESLGGLERRSPINVGAQRRALQAIVGAYR